MGTVARREDRGRQAADRSARVVGAEVRNARQNAGISIRDAARAVGIGASTLGRIERAELPNVSIRQLALACAAVGLELAVRPYPDGDPIADAAHAALLERVRACLPKGTPWRTEVPLPMAGDRRAWDAMALVKRAPVVFEAETHLRDMQALARKLELKRRDGGASLVVLVVADTRHNRAVLATHREALRAAFPLDTRAVLAALRSGRAPSASGIVMI
jgi:transcriptional regulator with XRE-family HTH domain